MDDKERARRFERQERVRRHQECCRAMRILAEDPADAFDIAKLKAFIHDAEEALELDGDARRAL